MQMVLEADPTQQFDHMFVDFIPAGSGNPERQGNIVEGRQMLQQPEFLKNDADLAAQCRQIPARCRSNITVKQVDQAA